MNIFEGTKQVKQAYRKTDAGMKDKTATFRKQTRKTNDDIKMKGGAVSGKEPLIMEEKRIRPNVIRRRIIRPTIDND